MALEATAGEVRPRHPGPGEGPQGGALRTGRGRSHRALMVRGRLGGGGGAVGSPYPRDPTAKPQPWGRGYPSIMGGSPLPPDCLPQRLLGAVSAARGHSGGSGQLSNEGRGQNFRWQYLGWLPFDPALNLLLYAQQVKKL